MPSTRPQAAFEPISPDLDVSRLVEETPNFEWVVRVNCEMIEHHGIEQFERLILVHVILGGKPLVIDHYDTRLDKWTFAVQWLRDNWGSKIVDARDLTANKNIPLTVQHYLKHMALLTNQWDVKNYKDKDRQRMYLKDIDCPPIWADKVRDHMPLGMFYMNDSTGDIDGFGAADEPDSNGPGTRKGRGIAKSGDLMSSLPKEMRAENLMCYIGHEGTYTPAHREMCASLGHNIMVEASPHKILEDGSVTSGGSSVWFMTETKERDVVSEYWLSRLGHDIEIEKHFAQVNAWKQAPFKVYVVEQKPGDLILIPPLAPHQVWNRGTRTMKVAWNRTTVETLEMAMDEALPKARMVCRDEQYKNKAIIYHTLQKYSKLLRLADKHRKSGMRRGQNDAKVRQLQKDFKRLQNLFTRIMVSESFSQDAQEKNVEYVPYDSNITCSYCRCNIFNRFLTCKSCVEKLPNNEEDTYDVCMDCYAMGRSCACISKLSWVEQWNWNELKEKHEMYRRQILEIEGRVDEKSPKSLRTELNLLGNKKTLAQICQHELARRPFHDIKKSIQGKNDGEVEREEVEDVDANGNVKKKKKVRRSEKYLREHGRCHVDCYWEPKWKQAHCNNCEKNYCYGNLYRAYDMMPQDIMADPDWKCPCCRKICGCRHCRHKPGFKQYTPKGTLLGHNTKLVADARSVESLVDFSFSNIAWIQKAGDDHEEDTRRLRRRLREAEVAMATEAQLHEDNYVGGESEPSQNVEGRLLQLAEQEGIPIDPALGTMTTSESQADSMEIDDEDAIVEHPEGGPQNTYNAENGATEPQYSVPDGGVMWDNAHAYDLTDAITYVYPDLDAPPQLPMAPVEGYTPALVPGYESAMPSEANGKIEMVDRKRKRGKLDEGDKPFVYKKAYKGKTRKSLVVKLAISKDKLAELERTFSIAQPALNEVNAPVISSDLQALNIEYHSADPPVVTGRAHVERVEDFELAEHDDEFTPGRSRDRRRPAPDGMTRPDPDAEITRRTTRMQAVTYAEPDEEEFNEVIIGKPKSSKLATMEKAVYDVDAIESEVENLEDMSQLAISKQAVLSKASSKMQDTSKRQQVADPKTSTTTPRATGTQGNRITASSADQIQPSIVRISPNNSSQPVSSSSAANPAQVPSKVFASAQANRKAKMAAIEGVETDSESVDEVRSDPGAPPVDSPSSRDPTEESSSSSEPSPEPSLELELSRPVHKAVGGKAPRISLPSMAPARSSPAPSKPTPFTKLGSVAKPAPIVLTAQKVSSADWGDSDSDNDMQPVKNIQPRPTYGFVPVNAKGIGNHVLPPKGATAKRSRGRPKMQR